MNYKKAICWLLPRKRRAMFFFQDTKLKVWACSGKPGHGHPPRMHTGMKKWCSWGRRKLITAGNVGGPSYLLEPFQATTAAHRCSPNQCLLCVALATWNGYDSEQYELLTQHVAAPAILTMPPPIAKLPAY